MKQVRELVVLRIRKMLDQDEYEQVLRIVFLVKLLVSCYVHDKSWPPIYRYSTKPTHTLVLNSLVRLKGLV